MGKTITMNLKVSEYTSRVLGVIKEKFGLKDKSKALEKFAQMFGEEFVEQEVSEEYLKKLLKIDSKHMRRYGRQKMTIKELDKLCEE